VSAPAAPEVVRFAGKPEPPARDLGKGRLPDFLIIGAAKSGTTSLWFYLQRHPELFFANPKELEFFAYPDRFEKGPGWYKAFFAGAGDHQLCGEASTAYARWPHIDGVPERIARTVPGVKLIYLMRHPVDRTYAQYRHRMRLPVPRMTFDEAIKADPEFVDTSLYMQQINRYLAHHPREQLLCLLSEDLKADPAGVLDRVQAFLGIGRVDMAGAGAIESNRAAGGGDDYARKRIRRLVKSVPGVRALSRAVPVPLKDSLLRALTASGLGQRLKRGYRPGPMTPAIESELIDRFREPNAELGRFLGRDLSHWSRPGGGAS